MLVELGNPDAKMQVFDPDRKIWIGVPAELDAPSVTYLRIPEGEGGYSFDPSTDIRRFKDELVDACASNDGITNGLDEALLMLLHPFSGLWKHHSVAPKPSWIHSDNEDFMRAVAEFHGPSVALGRPADLEDTHWTRSGPPGVVPGAVVDLEMLLVNSGRDIWARALAGGAVASISGHSTTAPTATTYTLDDQTAPGSTSAWNGMRIYATSGTNAEVWALVKSNTNATPPVLTLDRWYTSATPGGAAGATPAAGPYVIQDGAPPAQFVALTTTNITPGSGDTSLSGEYTAAGGGFIRKIAPFAHSAGTNTYTLTPVYTGNGSDTYPSTFYAIGVFVSMVSGNTVNTMMFETSLSASATVSASGDQLTVTETVTGT